MPRRQTIATTTNAKRIQNALDRHFHAARCNFKCETYDAMRNALDRFRAAAYGTAQYRALKKNLLQATAAHQSAVDRLRSNIDGTVANETTIKDDLALLEKQFPLVTFNGRCLTATTDEITLTYGTYTEAFGAFQIALDLRHMSRSADPDDDYEDYDVPWRTIAVTPNVAASVSDVTHPHIRANVLCAGDGRLPLLHAVSQGRIYDFFDIVSRILHTYADDQAYIQLENWHNVRCDCCAVYHPAITITRCVDCNMRLCNMCTGHCKACDKVLCTYCRCADHAHLCKDCSQKQAKGKLNASADTTKIAAAASSYRRRRTGATVQP